MLTYSNNSIKTSVRKLVEFLLRSGDITAGSGLIADPEAMQEGSRISGSQRPLLPDPKRERRSRSGLRLPLSWHR